MPPSAPPSALAIARSTAWSTAWSSARTVASHAATSRRLAGAVGVLVGLDAVGGAVAVADGVNPPRDAWGSRARLAAPWPMIAGQVALTVVASRARPAAARGAAGALGLACLVSAVSGFVDGGLAAPGLARRHVAFQVVLVGWTALTGLVAVAHAAAVTRPVVRGSAGGR